jgi:hypothetical protein
MPDFKPFYSIRPRGKLAASEGTCLSCAAETVKVLMSPHDYKPAEIKPDNAKYHESEVMCNEAYKTGQHYSTPQELFTALQKTEARNIFLANTEDHVFVIYKSNLNKLYLLDSAFHYFVEIKNAGNFIAPVNAVLNGCEYNYFKGEGERDTFTLYTIGKSHADWSEQVTLNSQPTLFYSAEQKPQPNEILEITERYIP